MTYKIRRLLGSGVAFGLLMFAGACKDAPPPPPPPPPVPVVASEVLVREQAIFLESVAQALGSQDVEIRARVEGLLEQVHFREGSLVKAGDLLYTIDPLTLKATLQQAGGNLQQAEAALEKARRDVARLTPLWEKNAISRQMLDDALAAERSAQGATNTAQAMVDNTRIQLGYAEIHAPIDGLIGKTEVKPGNLVGRGQTTLLTTLSSVDPIHFRYSVSEQEYLLWRRNDMPSAAQSGTNQVFELILADGTLHSERGHVVFADRNVDPTTGTLLLEVAFANPGRVIRPGQFGRIRVPVRNLPGAVLIPQRALLELQATYSVFVVGADQRAEFRAVKPGPRVGSLVVIESGLAPGEKVVVEGVQKIRHQTPVSATLRPVE